MWSLLSGREESALPSPGGHAVALHGAVRGTVDLDLVLALSRGNFTAAEASLNGMGLESRLPLKAEEVFDFREEYIRNRNLIAWSFVNPADPTEIVDIILTEDLDSMQVDLVPLGRLRLPVVAGGRPHSHEGKERPSAGYRGREGSEAYRFMRPVQYFSDEYLEQCKQMKPEDVPAVSRRVPQALLARTAEGQPSHQSQGPGGSAGSVQGQGPPPRRALSDADQTTDEGVGAGSLRRHEHGEKWVILMLWSWPIRRKIPGLSCAASHGIDIGPGHEDRWGVRRDSASGPSQIYFTTRIASRVDGNEPVTRSSILHSAISMPCCDSSRSATGR